MDCTSIDIFGPCHPQKSIPFEQRQMETKETSIVASMSNENTSQDTGASQTFKILENLKHLKPDLTKLLRYIKHNDDLDQSLLKTLQASTGSPDKDGLFAVVPITEAGKVKYHHYVRALPTTGSDLPFLRTPGHDGTFLKTSVMVDLSRKVRAQSLYSALKAQILATVKEYYVTNGMNASWKAYEITQIGMMWEDDRMSSTLLSSDNIIRVLTHHARMRFRGHLEFHLMENDVDMDSE